MGTHLDKSIYVRFLFSVNLRLDIWLQLCWEMVAKMRRDVAKSYAEVRVTGGDSSLHIRTPRGLLIVELPAGVSLVEGSCREAPGTGDEIHFRMRLNVDQHTDDTGALGSVMERLLVQESYCFHCQSCGTRVLEERVFKRVLPLPNGNWSSLVDDWCCHPDPFANLKLLPRAEDCLLGDTHLLVHRDRGCEETLTQELSPSPRPITNKMADGKNQDTQKPNRRRTLVSCKSCTAGLGEAVAPGTLKLYITEVTVRPSVGDSQFDTSLDRSLFLEQTIAARLVELSSSQSMYRFFIQTPDGKALILLWLLNSDSLIVSLSAAMSSTVRGDAVTSPSHRQCSERQSPTKAGSTVKVLYLPCSPSGSTHQDVVDTWEKDIGVHPLDLPQTTCQELLAVLTASTSCLPLSLHSMNSYQVAYMRL
ncbi:E3 ubiquitin-protein ligase E3D isoform X1 [Salmo salar]|uniref:E3 ubiquitin-protein ligase E3D n=1 Tax=Salmo salar TaxID=8030 RepID=A0A1S3RVJ7_SALSA|nr:E3 ubiquitin-protein ligase E3D-like isoform X1 [Salmo salar]|eukprot:XP_014055769.1 PREDICTED: E3 ubiquitin-protein ligase E3D-like isoform X3 [Salmo salar]